MPRPDGAAAATNPKPRTGGGGGGGIGLFLLWTGLLSAAVYGAMAMAPGFLEVAFLPLTWVPALAALLARRTGRSGRGGMGWKRCPARYLACALAIPLGLSALVYSAIWSAGLGRLDPEGLAAAARETFRLQDGSALHAVGIAVLFYCTVGLLFGTVLALGEEIG